MGKDNDDEIVAIGPDEPRTVRIRNAAAYTRYA